MENEPQINQTTATGTPLTQTGSPETHATVVHEHPLYSEPLFNIGSFPVTNSLLNTWVVVIILVVFSLVMRSKIRLVPRGLQNAFEMIVEGFLDIFDSLTGSRERSVKFFPFIFAFFIFILINNWMGLLPGVGSIGKIIHEGGENVFVPYIRGGTADLNTTLALATIGVVVSHIFGVVSIGLWKHFNKFINIRTFLEIPRKIRKDPSVLIINPIRAMVGLIELVGEAAKIVSLSFRLFGNMFAGEFLLAAMSAILAFGLPIPFMFLEVLVGLIQALIFAMLVLVYLVINGMEAEEH